MSRRQSAERREACWGCAKTYELAELQVLKYVGQLVVAPVAGYWCTECTRAFRFYTRMGGEVLSLMVHTP